MARMNARCTDRRIGSAVVALSLMLGFAPSALAKWSHGHRDSYQRHHGLRYYHDNSHDYYAPYRYRSPSAYGYYGRYRTYPYNYRYASRSPYGVRQWFRVFPRRSYARVPRTGSVRGVQDESHAVLEEPAALSSRTSWSVLMGEGDTLFKTSDFTAAAVRFKAATEVDPTDPISHFAYGHTLFALGRYAEAAASIREGMARYPDWRKVSMNRRSVYRDPTEFDQRLSHLKAWVEDHPEETDVGFLLGYYYYFTQQPQRAQETFQRVIELDPRDREARYFLTLQSDVSDVSRDTAELAPMAREDLGSWR